jgi:hypothetical protein
VRRINRAELRDGAAIAKAPKTRRWGWSISSFILFADMISLNGGKANLTPGVVYAEFRACGFAGRHQWPAL